MNVLKFIWKVVGVLLALRFLYFAGIVAGSWFGWTSLPVVSSIWLFLAFSGAFMLQMENVFPQLRRQQ